MNKQELLDQAGRLVLPGLRGATLETVAADFQDAFLTGGTTGVQAFYAYSLVKEDADNRVTFRQHACPRDNPRMGVVLDGTLYTGDECCMHCARMMACAVSGQTGSFQPAGDVPERLR